MEDKDKKKEVSKTIKEDVVKGKSELAEKPKHVENDNASGTFRGKKSFHGNSNSKKFFGNKKGGFKGRGRGARSVRQKPEFEQKIISIRRVTRVMAGGRRFSFSVGLIAGDKKGRVGVGVGKATDTSLAIEKALRNAKKNMITVKRTKTNSISHEISVKYGSSQIFIKPSPGKGVVAGSAVRNVLSLAGITDIISKINTRSKNKINIARATVNALKDL